jgi:hypothetical protein
MITLTKDNIGDVVFTQDEVQDLNLEDFNMRANMMFEEMIQDYIG